MTVTLVTVPSDDIASLRDVLPPGTPKSEQVSVVDLVHVRNVSDLDTLLARLQTRNDLSSLLSSHTPVASSGRPKKRRKRTHKMVQSKLTGFTSPKSRMTHVVIRGIDAPGTVTSIAHKLVGLLWPTFQVLPGSGAKPKSKKKKKDQSRPATGSQKKKKKKTRTIKSVSLPTNVYVVLNPKAEYNPMLHRLKKACGGGRTIPASTPITRITAVKKHLKDRYIRKQRSRYRKLAIKLYKNHALITEIAEKCTSMLDVPKVTDTYLRVLTNKDDVLVKPPDDGEQGEPRCPLDVALGVVSEEVEHAIVPSVFRQIDKLRRPPPNTKLDLVVAKVRDNFDPKVVCTVVPAESSKTYTVVKGLTTLDTVHDKNLTQLTDILSRNPPPLYQQPLEKGKTGQYLAVEDSSTWCDMVTECDMLLQTRSMPASTKTVMYGAMLHSAAVDISATRSFAPLRLTKSKAERGQARRKAQKLSALVTYRNQLAREQAMHFTTTDLLQRLDKSVAIRKHALLNAGAVKNMADAHAALSDSTLTLVQDEVTNATLVNTLVN